MSSLTPARPRLHHAPPILPLSAVVASLVRPGQHLHFASTPSRSNAAVRAVARRFRGTSPAFTISTSGFHSTAHLFGLYELAARYIACFYGDNYPAPRPSPLYARQAQRGAAFEHWSLLSYVTALRAGAQGQAFGVTRSLAGTTLGDELARHGRYLEVSDPTRPGEIIGLVRALRPDLTFVHGAVADEHGHVAFSAPRGEGLWGALAAREGVVVTVEKIVPGDLSRRHADVILVPPHRIRAICVEPFGAHPQPLYTVPGLDLAGYADDFAHYQRWAELAADPVRAPGELGIMLGAGDEPPDDGGERYARYVGRVRLAELAATVRLGRPAPARPTNAEAGDPLVVTAARVIAERVRRRGHKTILAGIGQGFLAARMARLQLAEEGIDVAVLVETGLFDLDCGPLGSPFLLARDNASGSRRLTDIDDVLGTLAAGGGEECLAVLGAAQVDRRGQLNSTRLADGTPLVGSGGACDVAAAAAEVIVVVRGAPGRLVDRVDHVTSPGGRVRAVVTDKGVLERDHAEASWRLTSLWPTGGTPGEALAALRRVCPWPLEIPAPLPLAAPPASHELALVQSLDPEGIARERRSTSATAAAPAPQERVHARRV